MREERALALHMSRVWGLAVLALGGNNEPPAPLTARWRRWNEWVRCK
jgi:hypothetical protein